MLRWATLQGGWRVDKWLGECQRVDHERCNVGLSCPESTRECSNVDAYCRDAPAVASEATLSPLDSRGFWVYEAVDDEAETGMGWRGLLDKRGLADRSACCCC